MIEENLLIPHDGASPPTGDDPRTDEEGIDEAHREEALDEGDLLLLQAEEVEETQTDHRDRTREAATKAKPLQRPHRIVVHDDGQDHARSSPLQSRERTLGSTEWPTSLQAVPSLHTDPAPVRVTSPGSTARIRWTTSIA